MLGAPYINKRQVLKSCKIFYLICTLFLKYSNSSDMTRGKFIVMHTYIEFIMINTVQGLNGHFGSCQPCSSLHLATCPFAAGRTAKIHWYRSEHKPPLQNHLFRYMVDKCKKDEYMYVQSSFKEEPIYQTLKQDVPSISN